MKKLVSLLLALLMVLSFGLLTAASAEPKEIVFWTALAGAYNDVIQNICADFNATQDEWKVVPEYQGNYYDIAAKLQASLLDGSEPDIVQMECSRTPLFSDYGSFAELSDMLANVGLDAKEYFYEGFMVDCDWGEGLYALPFNRSTPMFYYNKTLFDEMGLTVPTTWDELHETAKKLSIPGERWGFEVPIDQWFFCCFVRESGGELMNPEKTQLTVNNEAGAASLHWMRDMIEDGSMKAPPGSEYNGYEAARSDLSAGITTMIISSTGDLGTLRKICDFEVGTAFLPGNPNYGVVTGGANVCVLADHDDTAAGVAEFLKYLTSPDVAGQWAVTTGYVPTSEAAANSEVYQNYLKEVPAGVTALKQMEYAGNQPVIPQWAEIGATIITPEMQKCIEDSAYTPEMATQSMCDLVTTLLK